MNDKKVKDKRTKILEGFFPSSFDHIYKYDRDGRYTYASVGGARALGLKPTEMVGKTWEELGLPPELMEPFDDKLEAVFDSGQPLTGENTFKTIEGEKDFEYILNPILGNNGNVEKVECRVKDITGHKRAEQVVIESRLFANGIVETMHEPIVVLDSDLKVITANRSFYETFKITPKETEGQLLYELGTRQLNVPKLRKVLKTVIPKNTKIENFKVENEFPEIGKRTILLNARRINSDTVKSQMILLAIEDITEHKNAEEELRKHREHLEELVEARTVELNKINYLLEQEISERKLGKKRIEHLNTVLRAIRNVNRLITKEKDPDKLIASSCKQLIENMGYFNSWISIFDENGHYKTAASAGLGKDFSPIKKIMKAGKMLKCQKMALKKDGVVLIENPIKTCKGCPQSSKHQGTGVLVTRLEHEGRTYGTLTVSFPEALATDREEQMLFREMADDISFALHGIGIEEERKRAEAARREVEELLGTTLKSIGDAVISTDEKGNINFMNHTAEQLTGWSQVKVVGKPLEKVFNIQNEDTGKKVERPVKRVLREGNVVGLANHTMLINKDGTKIPIADSGAPIRSDDNKIIGTVLVFQDITERRQAECEVQEAREYAENIITTVREPLVVLGADLKVISANRSFYQTFKVKPKETEGQIIYDLGNRQWNIPKLRKLLEEILPKNSKFDNYEVEHKFETIGQRIMLLNARRIYRETNKTQMILIAIEDITELKRMQVQLVRSEKLAVLGQLAGGVGHELRNPLGAIKNAAYFLNMAIEKPEPEVKESLEILDQEVTTSDRIISNLLDFARTKPPTRRKVDVNDIVRKSVSQITIPENIKVMNKLNKVLPTTLADSEQLNHIFEHIILNAIQAMPEGGRLTIKSKMKSPEQVAVSFKDTGVGIPKENLSKLFEPLFTTKAKGIGLGLVVVKSFVEGHSGTIDVQSDPGNGSTFTIRLPISVKEGE